MARIRQEDLEAVRERTDIVKLVSGYLTLKRSGHDTYTGLCPFHAEKTPSFSVSPSKGVFHCFGCGAGGDAITFLREIEHLSFAEAVERLAKEAGVSLRYEGETPGERRAASRRQALHRANERAAELYHRMLLEGREAEEARAYLRSRGIDREAWETFGIGYAPGYPDFLLRRLARSLSTEILIEAGLAVRDAEGNVRDRFRGRITFPIHDLSGRAVGFGARALPGARQEPKYLNSPETPVYRKGEVLYNLHRAKAAASRTGELVVVEGYTDVIALAQAGVEGVVATCGTALGEGHLRAASRFAERLVLAFDSDEAGARAAERAYPFLERYPIRPVVLILPEGQDPADFARSRGGEAFRALAAEAEPLLAYMLRRAVGRHDLSTVEGRSAAVSAALPLLEGIGDPVRRSEYAHVLAELTGVAETSIAAALAQRLERGGAEPPRATKRASGEERAEREMLRLLARDAETYRALAERLTEEHFQTASGRRLFAALREADGDLRRLIGGEEALARSLSALALEPLEGDPVPGYAEEVWERLEEFRLRRLSEELRRRLQRMNPTSDEGYDELFRELIETDGRLRRLREGWGVPAT